MTPDWERNGVRIVRAGELDTNTPQTPGMTRAAAINHAKAGASKLWAGTVVVEPNAINIGRLAPAVPVTPPDMRVRIRRFGELSYRRPVNLGIPSESKYALGSATCKASESANRHGP